MKTSTQTCVPAREFGNEEAVRMICEAGFDCLDHSMFGGKPGSTHIEKDCFLSDMKKLKKTAESYGMEFNQTHAPFASFREGEDDYNNWVKPLLIKAIEATGVLGAEYVVIHPFVVSDNKKQANMEFFGSLIPYAEKNGVSIALENMFTYDPEKDCLIKAVCADGPEFADYIDSLGSKNVCACLDVGHCGLVGEDPAKMIHQLGSRLKCLHIHDNDHLSDKHTLPFLEKIDFAAIIKALREIGYTGEMTLEADSFLYGLPKELYADGLKMMGSTARYLAELF